MNRMHSNKETTELVTMEIIDILKNHVGRHNAIKKVDLQEEVNKRLGCSYTSISGQSMSYRVTAIIRDTLGIVVLNSRYGYYLPESDKDFEEAIDAMTKHRDGMTKRIAMFEKQRKAFQDALKTASKVKDSKHIARLRRNAFVRHSVALRGNR